MPKLMVNGDEIVAVHLGAHLDPEIVLVVQIPGGGVAHHLAVARPGDLRALPERLGQRRKSQRGEKALAGLHHLRSEEHTSELQSLMRISYAVFCLQKKKKR